MVTLVFVLDDFFKMVSFQSFRLHLCFNIHYLMSLQKLRIEITT
jgi:hypothetical protein